jgi:hypothetical protein
LQLSEVELNGKSTQVCHCCNAQESILIWINNSTLQPRYRHNSLARELRRTSRDCGQIVTLATEFVAVLLIEQV